MTVTKENIKDFTEKYAQICRKNDTVEKELFTEYGVKRGLRDLNGKGVLTGITNISRVESSKIVERVCLAKDDFISEVIKFRI